MNKIILSVGIGLLVSAGTILAATNTNHPPSLTFISGPFALTVGQTGTWILKGFDPDADRLIYIADWRDGTRTYSTSTPSFSHKYATANLYVPIFNVVDSMGSSTRLAINIRVSSTTSPTVLPKITSQPTPSSTNLPQVTPIYTASPLPSYSITPTATQTVTPTPMPTYSSTPTPSSYTSPSSSPVYYYSPSDSPSSSPSDSPSPSGTAQAPRKSAVANIFTSWGAFLDTLFGR
jgi:hypothetical protein